MEKKSDLFSNEELKYLYILILEDYEYNLMFKRVDKDDFTSDKYKQINLHIKKKLEDILNIKYFEK
jgi:hypothetical protein